MDSREVEVQPVQLPPHNITKNFTALLTLNRVYQKKGVKIYDGSASNIRVRRNRERSKVARRSRQINRQRSR